MDNFITPASLEYEQYFARMNDWTDPRDLLRDVIAAQEKRVESYARRPDAKPDIVARNRGEVEKLVAAYWCLFPMDMPIMKLITDLINEAKKKNPNYGVAMIFWPLKLWGEGESVFIDLAGKNIV
jgi:hypothetical protein